MTKFAAITPVRMMEYVIDHAINGDDICASLLTGYHMVVTPDVLNNPAQYRLTYSKLRHYYATRRIPFHVILDNGVIEGGTSNGIEAIAEATDIVKPHFIVLPDILRDAIGTAQASIAGRDALYSLSVLGPQRSGAAPMIVPQGKDESEILKCLTTLLTSIQEVGMVGIPRWIANDFGTRKEIGEKIAATVLGFNSRILIHLLGSSKYLHNDLLMVHQPYISGIDTSLPFWYDLSNFYFDVADDGGIRQTRPKDFFEEPTEDDCERMIASWLRMNKLVSGH